VTDAPTAALIDAARGRLRAAPRERLGERATARRMFGIGRAARIVPLEEVWHVGVLLIGDARVLATGRVIRARAEVIRGYPAQSQRERAELAAAARRGGFAEGETLHLDWTALDVPAVDAGGSSGPLSLEDGVPYVRWTAVGGIRPLADYLRDQLSLIR